MAGNYYEPACAMRGLIIPPFASGCKGDRRSRPIFRVFEEVKRAEAEAEARMVAQWQAQVPNDWKAARDFLARRYPERWAQKERIDLEHSGEVVTRHDTTRITEQLAKDREFLEAIQRAYSEREGSDLL